LGLLGFIELYILPALFILFSNFVTNFSLIATSYSHCKSMFTQLHKSSWVYWHHRGRHAKIFGWASHWTPIDYI